MFSCSGIWTLLNTVWQLGDQIWPSEPDWSRCASRVRYCCRGSLLNHGCAQELAASAEHHVAVMVKRYRSMGRSMTLIAMTEASIYCHDCQRYCSLSAEYTLCTAYDLYLLVPFRSICATNHEQDNAPRMIVQHISCGMTACGTTHPLKHYCWPVTHED